METPEIWSPVIQCGKEHPWYSISNHGNLVTHIRNTIGARSLNGKIAKGSTTTNYDPNYSKRIKPVIDRRNNYSGNGSFIKSLYYNIYFPIDFFDGTLYEYDFYTETGKTIKKKCYFHRMVMEAFRPIDKFPPERLKDDWTEVPYAVKQWIYETAVVNHIDHDPTNNKIDNLEWVTQKENARKAVEFYGGNPSNKNKIITIDSSQEIKQNTLLEFFN